jgi:hypothetical protein
MRTLLVLVILCGLALTASAQLRKGDKDWSKVSDKKLEECTHRCATQSHRLSRSPRLIGNEFNSPM